MIKISRLKDLSIDKETIMIKFAQDQELCKALYYNSRDFRSKPDIADPHEDILFQHIFPYRFIPGLDNEEKNYITMSFRKFRPVRDQYKSGIIYLYAITPRKPDVIRTNDGLRYDFILSKIDEIMNKSGDFGIGKLEFYDMDEFDVNDKYVGQYIAYKLYQFN